jgi:hypothetical protein
MKRKRRQLLTSALRGTMTAIDTMLSDDPALRDFL